MKYVLASLVCVGVAGVYGIIAEEFMGWRHMGGAIPVFLLLMAIGGIWHLITKKHNSGEKEERSNPILKSEIGEKNPRRVQWKT